MRRELRKRTKRLFGLMLAAIMTVTSVLPAFAADADKNVIDPMDLEVGDILLPGQKIAVPDWFEDQKIVYFDYAANGISTSFNRVVVEGVGVWRYIYALDQNSYVQEFAVKPYSNEGENALEKEPTALKADEFAGWRVMSGVRTTSSSIANEILFLMAIPKNATKTIRCTAGVNVDSSETIASETRKQMGVEFSGYDQKTGELCKKDSDGALLVSPGDLVFAYTRAVAGYKCTGLSGVANNGALVNCYGATDNYLSYLMSEEGWVLPPDAAETDAIMIFVAPYADVEVTATYTSAENCTVSYQDANGTDIGSDSVPYNTLITLWNPANEPIEGRMVTNADEIVLWDCIKMHPFMPQMVTVGSYRPGGSFRVKDNCVFRAVRDEGDTIPFTVEDKALSAHLCDRQNVVALQNYDHYIDHSAMIKFDPEQVDSGKSLTGFQVIKQGGETASYSCRDLVNEGYFGYGYDDYFYDTYSVFNEPVEKTMKGVYTTNPKDLTLDLREGSSFAYLNSEDPDASDYIYLYTYFDPYRNSKIDSMWQTDAGYLYEDCDGYIVVDLNHDKKPDLYTTAKEIYSEGDYNLLFVFKRLPGAAYCNQSSYELKCNQGGYGTFTVKLFDSCKVEYISDGKTIYTQDAKKTVALGTPAKEAAVTKDGYTFKGWSSAENSDKLYDFTTPVTADLKLYAVWEKAQTTDPGKQDEKAVAVKDEVVDEKTGSTFVVTAVGEKNEVALRKPAVNKGVVTVPDSVKVGGKEFQVTAIEKGAFKNTPSMKTLDLGANITKLFKGAFKNCKKLKVIKIRNKKKVIALNKNMFGNGKGKITLKVYKKLVKKYKAAIKKKKLTKRFKVKKW